MARSKRTRQHRRLGTHATEALSTAACGAILIGAFAVLMIEFGWLWGFLAGWVAAPLLALAGAALVLLWTAPLRETGVLSLRPNGELDQFGAPRAALKRQSISVIVPAYNAMHYLRESLPPLMALRDAGEIAEVIVVDDGSTDGGAEFAAAAGAKVVPSGGRRGPGGARNVAARQAQGDVLWFVDADVVVHPTAVEHVRSALARPDVAAVFGSYDDSPSAKNFGSQYKNLVHHHYHQHADPRASTFWAGCGAVARKAFLDLDGFDADTYGRPAIEDVDLGCRIRAAGGIILLDRHLLSTHLKRWSVPELVRTDIFSRAIPWSRLMLQRSEVLDDLNVGTFERLRALLAGATVLSLAGAVAGLLHPAWLAPILLTIVTGNWHLFALFKRRRGLGFAVAGLAFHQLYYLYSSASFSFCWIEARLQGSRAASALPPAAAANERAAQG